MNYAILNSVITKFLNITGTIDKVKQLKDELNYRIGCAGSYDVINNSQLIIGYETEDTYHKNMDMYQAQDMSLLDIEIIKMQGRYNYDKTFITRDFIYPTVVYRTKDNGAFWIRTNNVHVFNNQNTVGTNFSTESEYTVQVSNFSKEDLFGIRLVSDFNFDEETLFEAIKCYQLLKQLRLNMLFDIREGKENK